MRNWSATRTERIDDRWRPNNHPYRNSYRNRYSDSYRNSYRSSYRHYDSLRYLSRRERRRMRRINTPRPFENGKHHIERAPNTGLSEFIKATANDKDFPIDPTGDVVHKLSALNIQTINDYVSFGIKYNEKGDNWRQILEKFIQLHNINWLTTEEEASNYFHLGQIHYSLLYFRNRRDRAIDDEMQDQSRAESMFHGRESVF